MLASKVFVREAIVIKVCQSWEGNVWVLFKHALPHGCGFKSVVFFRDDVDVS